jgi:leucyl/phenylalanyl-tRNA--protein transferase
MGNVWFGESIFTTVPHAGNFVLTRATQKLIEWGFTLVDCQFPSPHLARFGAESWPRDKFLSMLRKAVNQPRSLGKWNVSMEKGDFEIQNKSDR